MLVLRQEDANAAAKARQLGLQVSVAGGWELPRDRVLFAAPDVTVPWDLVLHGMHFLDKWDVAAPLWRAGVLAQDVGTASERRRTERIVRDLRVPLYAHELLFVRNSEMGRAFLNAWQAEMAEGPDERLAFIRALYLVKPIFCALPRSWLAEVQERAARDAQSGRRVAQETPALVKVEVGRNRFVRCRPGEEEQVRQRYVRQQMRRSERRKQEEAK